MSLDWNYTVVSLGGITVGLSLITWRGVQWWLTDRRGKKAWLRLTPFVVAPTYGIMVILTTGGVLGSAASGVLWGANVAGDAALEYGVNGHHPNVTRNYGLALSDGGHAVLVIFTVGIVAYWMYGRKLPKRDVLMGVVCGISLGLAGGVAGWAADVLVPMVNGGGDWVAGIQ